MNFHFGFVNEMPQIFFSVFHLNKEFLWPTINRLSGDCNGLEKFVSRVASKVDTFAKTFEMKTKHANDAREAVKSTKLCQRSFKHF